MVRVSRGLSVLLISIGGSEGLSVDKSMRQPTFFMAFDYDYTGNIALLDLPKVAFFASREVSPEQRRSALRWAEQTIRTGDTVISGFHSPLEAEILERLLAARHPVIWAHARTLHRHYPPHVEQALAEGRILIFAARNIPRAGLRAAQARNCIVASMAARSLFVINASAGRHSSLAVIYDMERMSGRATLLQ